MDTVNQLVAKILNEYYETGFFTHAHCLAGSLDSNDIYADVFLSPNRAEVFDLASITKAVCTAPLIYQLIVKLNLDPEHATFEQLCEPWPKDLKNHFKSLHVKKLLRHESGLPPWRNFWINRLGFGKSSSTRVERSIAIIDKFNQLAPEDLMHRPVYSDTGFILLGMALETYYNKDLADIFNDMVAPLNSPNAIINYQTHIKSGTAIIPSAFCNIRNRMLVGEVHDENSSSLGGQTGHAGVFGNVYGLVALIRWLYQDSTGKNFLEINANHIIANDSSGDGARLEVTSPRIRVHP